MKGIKCLYCIYLIKGKLIQCESQRVTVREIRHTIRDPLSRQIRLQDSSIPVTLYLCSGKILVF